MEGGLKSLRMEGRALMAVVPPILDSPAWHAISVKVQRVLGPAINEAGSHGFPNILL